MRIRVAKRTGRLVAATTTSTVPMDPTGQGIGYGPADLRGAA